MTEPPPTEYVIVTGRNDAEAVDRLLSALPDWFGIEEANIGYVADARTMPTYLAIHQASRQVHGVLLVHRHNPGSAEIHLLAVDPEHHRRGIGSALVRAYEHDMRADGVRLLQVKTLGPSDPDEFYARTTAFYVAMGYLPLQELHDYWPSDPCLILVKPA